MITYPAVSGVDLRRWVQAQRQGVSLGGGICPGQGVAGRRRWRALDLGTIRAELEADALRVSCARHGVVVAQVPWARHGSWHTRPFEDTVAWLACVTSKTTICELMRIS